MATNSSSPQQQQTQAKTVSVSPSNVLSLQGLQGQIIQVFVKSFYLLGVNQSSILAFFFVMQFADQPGHTTLDFWWQH